MTTPEVYLTPQYLTLDMFRNQLGKNQIKLTLDVDPQALGLFEPQALDLIAKGEAYVIKTILSDYVNIPLQTIYYQGAPNGTDFNDLYDTEYRQTYVEIRDLLMNSAYWQIYNFYYAVSGTTNGSNIIRVTANRISAYINQLQRLDQAGNPKVKNAFSGLKVAANGSQRIAKTARNVKGIPTGQDQATAAFRAIPNYLFGFNK